MEKKGMKVQKCLPRRHTVKNKICYCITDLHENYDCKDYDITM